MAFPLVMGEQIARLALKLAADRIERGKADRLRLAGLQDRQIGERQADPVGQIGQCHAPLVQQLVELDSDGHQTVPSRSSRMIAPSLKMRARMSSSGTANQPVKESDQPRYSPLASLAQMET